MKKLANATTLLLAGAAALPALANLTSATDPWSGLWRDAQGGQLVVLAQGGVLDVQGSDSGSIYRLTCVVDRANPRSAQCVGDGLNREAAPFRFIYRSQWRLTPDGLLQEEWDARYAAGQRSGKAEFKPVGGAAGTR